MFSDADFDQDGTPDTDRYTLATGQDERWYRFTMLGDGQPGSQLRVTPAAEDARTVLIETTDGLITGPAGSPQIDLASDPFTLSGPTSRLILEADLSSLLPYLDDSSVLASLQLQLDYSAIVPSVRALDPTSMVGADGRLFLATTGRELAVPDGTASGTQVVDLFPAIPQDLTAAGGEVFFTYDASGGKFGLVRSDGTPTGTLEIQLDPSADLPRRLTDIDGTLYFTAIRGGLDGLWKVVGNGVQNVGSISIRVDATDTGNLSASGRFDVMVANTNDKPVFTSTPATEVTEFFDYRYSIATSDDDAGDVLAITVSTLPAWLSLVDHGDGTATLSGVPLSQHVGSQAVTLRVTDAAGAADSQWLEITVADFPPQLLGDIDDFRLALNAPATYLATYSVPAIAIGDINQDGVIDLGDADALANLLGVSSSSQQSSPDSTSTSAGVTKVLLVDEPDVAGVEAGDLTEDQTAAVSSELVTTTLDDPPAALLGSEERKSDGSDDIIERHADLIDGSRTARPWRFGIDERLLPFNQLVSPPWVSLGGHDVDVTQTSDGLALTATHGTAPGSGRRAETIAAAIARRKPVDRFFDELSQIGSNIERDRRRLEFGRRLIAAGHDDDERSWTEVVDLALEEERSWLDRALSSGRSKRRSSKGSD